MSVSIKYKGAEIASANTDTSKTIKTSGKYCEADIEVINTQDGVSEVEWHQCPQLVRDYLDNVTYNPNDYSTSKIYYYAPSFEVTSNTKPIGKTVDGVTYYNEVPNVKTPFASTNAAGTLKPLDFVRWINTASAVNVRDIGGWNCDGGTVKYGLMFRGGALTIDDRSALVDECDVRVDIDLRGSSVADTTSPLGSDVYYTKTIGDLRYSLTDTADWTTVIRTIFDAVAHREPVYVHCSQGADRTGTVFFVLELLLGVAQNDCDKDYELSCFGRNNTYWGTRATASYIPKLIGEINEVYGNGVQQKVINWIYSLGFTDAEMNAFRKSMINGNPQDISHTEAPANLVPTSVDPKNLSAIYNGTGYKDGYRGNSSYTESALAGNTITGLFPFDPSTDTILVKGGTFLASTSFYFTLYNASGTGIAWANGSGAFGNGHFKGSNVTPPVDADGYYIIYEPTMKNCWVTLLESDPYNNAAYGRISISGNGADLIIKKG